MSGHQELADAAHAAVPWRLGQSNPFNIYAQVGHQPNGDDPMVCMVPNAWLARCIVADHNEAVRRSAYQR